MIELRGFAKGIWLADNCRLIENAPEEQQELAALAARHEAELDTAAGRAGTMAYQILKTHDKGDGDRLELAFDALASHDITYVGIIQTARAAGLARFPVPYVLTNCHNSLCAVGGTINEDDHLFGLSAARKYGGIYVPPHAAVIHQYVREMLAAPGRMILGSDSHTRYGFLGTLGIGEGGPELARQLLGLTYSLARPRVVAVYLDGAPQPGVGPQDVALAIIGAVFGAGVVKNAVLEFVGPGVGRLSADFRAGVDVMTTETACLSSIWLADGVVRDYLAVHGRDGEYRLLAPAPLVYYDGALQVNLSEIAPMIALPFHPSNVFTIDEVNSRPQDFLEQVEAEARAQLGERQVELTFREKVREGRLLFDQGVIAGCSGGTHENICTAADVLRQGDDMPAGFSFSVYPASLPIQDRLMAEGVSAELLRAGAVLRSAFCGPCFGAGDVPAHNGLSARHTTRNFPFREGSKPGDGQVAAVALLDARSIAATVANGGKLTAATEVIGSAGRRHTYVFDASVYRARVYNGFNRPEPGEELRFGPNIKDWPQMPPLPSNLLLKLCAVIRDPVTTTDELIPSGETSSYRSNPYRLAEYTLSRRCPEYVGLAKTVREQEQARQTALAEKGADCKEEDLPAILSTALSTTRHASVPGQDWRRFAADTGIGSAIFAFRPGDGSAREQAASSQKVLGGWANLACEYATKRYRSNVVNWGMLPFIVTEADAASLRPDQWLYVPEVRAAVQEGRQTIQAYLLAESEGAPAAAITLQLPEISAEERRILLAGGLIGFLKEQAEEAAERR